MKLKSDFPIFECYQHANEGNLIYLDSAATSQRPKQVLDAEINFLTHSNAAAHRGVSRLAYQASEAYESARNTVAKFLNAKAEEIIFTKNATEAINLVAYSLSNLKYLGVSSPLLIKPGDEIVITEVEHHANIIPWQELCKRTGAVLKWIQCDSSGKLLERDIEQKITDRCKLLAITHQSNVTGQITPLDLLIKRAKSVGALTLLDACQSAPRMLIDVKALQIDFLVFSGHKTLGPSGIGVLYGKSHLLQLMPPFLTGGSMIDDVFMDTSTYTTEIPRRFEPGVPPVSQAVGLASALNYMNHIGMSQILKHEVSLTQYAINRLSEMRGITLYGSNRGVDRPGVISFNINGVHAHDVGQSLDENHVVVRVGHHCAKPLLRKLGIHSSVRASFHVYNDESDVDALVNAIYDAQLSFEKLGII
jgi:cysteine desulfurase / selenocysteine lyase